MGLQEIQEFREAWLHVLHERLLALDDEQFAAAHQYIVTRGEPSRAEREVFIEVVIERDRRGRVSE